MSKVGNYANPAPPPQYPMPQPYDASTQYQQPQPQIGFNQMQMGYNQPFQQQQNLMLQQSLMMQQSAMFSQMGAMSNLLLSNQPQLPVVWMRPPPPMPNYPPGLEFLANLDKILIQQEIASANILAAFSGNKNRYKILNGAGEQMYLAAENPSVDFSTYQDRIFIIQVFDQQNREVMRITRESAPCGCPCCICCCKSCAVELKVEAPPGRPIGMIRQQSDCCRVSLGVMDANEKVQLHFETPAVFGTIGNVSFPILSTDSKTEIGSIVKFYSGELQEFLTKADNFGVYVPPNLDINMKAILLAGVFLIDFLFFESRGRHGHRHY